MLDFIKELRVIPFIRNVLHFNELYSHSYVCTQHLYAQESEVKLEYAFGMVKNWIHEYLNDATYVGHAEERTRNKRVFLLRFSKVSENNEKGELKRLAMSVSLANGIGLRMA